MGLVPRAARPVRASTGRPCSGSSGRVAGEPDSSPSLPSQGSPGASFQPALPCSPAASPILQLGGPYLREAPLERVKEWGGSSGHSSALSRVPSPWRSFSPSVQDFCGRSAGDRQTHEQTDRIAGGKLGERWLLPWPCHPTSPGSALENCCPPCPVPEPVP